MGGGVCATREHARHSNRRRGRLAALVLLCAVPLASVGCGNDSEALRQKLDGPPTRLPVPPNQPDTPPVPALLDTVQPWKPPAAYPSRMLATWAEVRIHVDGTHDITYRVPTTWTTSDSTGKSYNVHKQVTAQARLTDLDSSQISLAAYAAQLAEQNPLYQYTTHDGHVVYLTRREVALAPSDPNAPRQFFHTAVVSIGDHIVKLDVRYDSAVSWRFNDLADAINGTIQVVPRLAETAATATTAP
ncbi:MAG: hypothetical protein JWN41_1203 [Thermoleophilia bacterium]|nr:hypothetical protein [Thermoleophilia bacterium]